MHQLRHVVDSHIQDPIRAAMRSELREAIAKLLRQRCRKRDAQIMELRYGLRPDSLSYTVEETARILQIDCRRVRAVENFTIEKLRQRPGLLAIL